MKTKKEWVKEYWEKSKKSILIVGFVVAVAGIFFLIGTEIRRLKTASGLKKLDDNGFLKTILMDGKGNSMTDLEEWKKIVKNSSDLK